MTISAKWLIVNKTNKSLRLTSSRSCSLVALTGRRTGTARSSAVQVTLSFYNILMAFM